MNILTPIISAIPISNRDYRRITERKGKSAYGLGHRGHKLPEEPAENLTNIQ